MPISPSVAVVFWRIKGLPRDSHAMSIAVNPVATIARVSTTVPERSQSCNFNLGKIIAVLTSDKRYVLSGNHDDKVVVSYKYRLIQPSRNPNAFS